MYGVSLTGRLEDKLRPKLRDMYDGPLQVCAYMGAVNQDEKYPVKVGGCTEQTWHMMDPSHNMCVC